MLPRRLRWLYPDPIVLDRLFLEPDQQRNGWQRDLDFRWRRYRGVCRGASRTICGFARAGFDTEH
jgi:hypothetical protein